MPTHRLFVSSPGDALRERQRVQRVVERSPFPGLLAYDAARADVFFGRSRDIARAVEAWREAARAGTPFLLLTGPSGAGKSSLMRAGVAPRLTAPGAVEGVDAWRVVEMRPSEGGRRPLAALAAALLPVLADDAHVGEAELTALLLHADAVATGPVLAALDRASARMRQAEDLERQARVDLVLLVDQLDELFAASVSAEDRAKFGALLGAFAATGRVWIAATLRADLYEPMLREPSLFALKEKGATCDLVPPGPAELAEIVRRTAEATGLVYEREPGRSDGLEEKLLRDADRPDMLPLLQLALAQLFEAREKVGGESRLTLGAYAALGDLSGIIDKSGEAAVAGIDAQALARLPRLVRQLAVPAQGSGDTLTTRDVPQPVAAPDEASRRLVGALVAARLLQAKGEGAAAVLRLAHQRVLADWGRARAIVAESADFGRIRHEIGMRREAYEDGGRRAGLLVPRGLKLAEAHSVVQRYGDEVPEVDRAFVAASWRRAGRARTLTLAAACLFALVAVGAGIASKLAWDQRAAAVAAERQARREEAVAQRNLAAAEGAAHDLVIGIARSLRGLAGVRVAMAREVLERAGRLVLALAAGASDEPKLLRGRAAILGEFAATYRQAGDLRAAERTTQEGLSLLRRLLESDSAGKDRKRDVMLASLNLAGIWQAMGRRAAALALYGQALTAARELATARSDPTATLDLASALDQLAALRLVSGERAEAEKTYGESFAVISDASAHAGADARLRLALAAETRTQGELRLARSDPAGALARFDEAVAIGRPLVADEAAHGDDQAQFVGMLVARGEARLAMNDAAGALKDAGEAVALARGLVARDGGRAEWQSGLAAALTYLGDSEDAAGQSGVAARDEGLGVARGVAARDPDNAERRLALSDVLWHIGDAKLAAGDPGGAKAAIVEMVAIRRAVAATDTENTAWTYVFAMGLERQATLRMALGDRPAARTDIDAAVVAIRDILDRDPDNVAFAQRLAAILDDLGDIRLAGGDRPGARLAYSEGIGIGRARIARGSDDGEWQRDLSLGLERIAALTRDEGDLAGARRAYEEAVAIRRKLVERDGRDLRWRRDLVLGLDNLGDLAARQNDGAAARKSYADAVAQARTLADGAAGGSQGAADLAASLDRLGKALGAAGDEAGAAASYRESVALWRKLTALKPDDRAARQALAAALEGLAAALSGHPPGDDRASP